jgi:cytochrome c biogenesis protein CcdA
MENQNTPTPESSSLFDLGFDENTKTALKGTATVAGIAAILGIITAGLSAVGSFMEKKRVPAGFEEYQSTQSTSNAFNMVGTVISLLIAFLLFYFLNKFANNTKTGLSGNNQGQVSEGLANLSSYFKTVGILLIIILCFVFLGLLALLAGSASSR